MDRKLLFLLVIFIIKESASHPVANSKTLNDDLILESIETGRSYLKEYLDGLIKDISTSLEKTLKYNEKLLDNFKPFIETVINDLQNDNGKISKVRTFQEKHEKLLDDEITILSNLAEYRIEILIKEMEILSSAHFEFDVLEQHFKKLRDETAGNACKANLYNAFNHFELPRLVPSIIECPAEEIYKIPLLSPLMDSIQMQNSEKLIKIKSSLIDCKNGWSWFFNWCVNKISKSLNDFVKELHYNIKEDNSEFEKEIEKQNKSNKKCLQNANADYAQRFEDFNLAFKKC